MIRRRPSILALAALASLLAMPSAAQMPDPRDPQGYFPLAVGNEWEYRLDLTRPASPGVPDRSRTEYVRLQVTARTASPDGDVFTLVDSRYTATSDLIRRDTALVRFDTATASVRALTVGPDGQTAYTAPFPFFACDLDLPFNGPLGSGRLFWIGASVVEINLDPLTGSATPVEAKEFANFVYGFTAVHGIGFVRGGGGCEPCGPSSSRDDWSLVFARVGGATYGTRVVASSPRPTEAGTLVVFPNPTAGWLTVRPGGGHPGETVAVEVYDALGRRVLALTAISGSPQVLDLSRLPRGVYTVWAAADVARVVVR